MSFWNWVQSVGFLAQSAHFFAGISIVLSFALWLRPRYAFLLLMLFAVPKELLIDDVVWGEGHGSPDWEDLAFYLIGGGFALSLLCIKNLLTPSKS